MLAIARALMTNPELLLMDEPTEGLAPLLVREVGRVIESLKAEGLSILLVEQNLPLALCVSRPRARAVARARRRTPAPPSALWAERGDQVDGISDCEGSAAMRREIAIVGVGLLGSAVASRLLEAASSVAGYDTRPDQLPRLLRPRGLEPAASLKDVAGRRRCVFTILPTPDAVEAAILGAGGAAGHAPRARPPWSR